MSINVCHSRKSAKIIDSIKLETGSTRRFIAHSLFLLFWSDLSATFERFILVVHNCVNVTNCIFSSTKKMPIFFAHQFFQIIDKINLFPFRFKKKNQIDSFGNNLKSFSMYIWFVLKKNVHISCAYWFSQYSN